MPEAAEPFDYFRSIAGEHPDWDEYKQAMADQGRSPIRITPTSWGPVATGGFPPELADPMCWRPVRRAPVRKKALHGVHDGPVRSRPRGQVCE